MHPALTGLIPAPFTPLRPDGSLNLARIDELARHYAAQRVTGAFVAGTTGEAQSLTVSERQEIARAWVEVGKPRGLKIIVQVGHNCVAEARALAAHAAKIGADAIAAHASCFFRPSSVAELIDGLAPIAAEAPQVPFYFYDIPSMTNVRLPMVDFLRAGKDRIPNLRGLKYTNMDLVQFQHLVHLDNGSFDILFGHDELLLPATALGAKGAVGNTYNFAVPLYQRLLKAFADGHIDVARRLQLRAVEMINVFLSFGFLPATKATMEFIGLDCGPVRAPLSSLDSDRKAALREKLTRLEVIWKPEA